MHGSYAGQLFSGGIHMGPDPDDMGECGLSLSDLSGL